LKQAARGTQYLVFLLAFFCGFNCVASAPTLTITSAFDRLQLDTGLEYYEDVKAELTLQQVSQEKDWSTWNQGTVNFGFSSSAYWLRCTLANGAKTDLPVMLEIAFPLLQRVDVYVGSESGSFHHFQSGSLLPPNKRPLVHSLLVFPFELPASSSSELFIRVHSNSLLQIPLALSGAYAFANYDHARSLFFGGLYSLLAVIGLYHCLIFFSVRDKSFLFYGLFSLSLSFGFFLLNGSAGSYLWPSNPNSSVRTYLIAQLLATFFGMLFIRSILNLPQSLPGWDRAIINLAWLSLLLIPACLFVAVSVVTLISLVLANVAVICATITIVKRTKEGYPPARYLLIAIVFTAVGIVVTVSSSLTVIPTNNFTIHAVYVGLSLGTMLYAFALAYRINLERENREKAQNEVIELQQHANENLDQLVKERTLELEASNERLREISQTDGLTQLSNRGYFDIAFDKELRRCIRNGRVMSVLLLDLDHFKQLNDRYGHQFGDQCLRAVATIMIAKTRQPPDLVARYGGEEFVILLPETDLNGAIHVAENIRQSIAEYCFQHNDEEIRITVSIGLCSAVPDRSATTAAFLKTADDCLYLAKQNGRNRVECQR